MAVEAAQLAVDERMLACLEGKGDPPTRKMMDLVDELCSEAHEARGELDQFILEHAT